MLLLALLSNFMGDDLRNVLSRKSLLTGSSHEMFVDWVESCKYLLQPQGEER